MTGRVRNENGFTLPELLVAIVILGIIMVAIGAMITTSFRTTTIVRARLDASRAPKLVSTYWVPDVEGAETVELGGGADDCGSGDRVLVTFMWHTHPAIGGTVPPVENDHDPVSSATWWLRQNGTRQQVVRLECANGRQIRTATVVPEIAAGDVAVTDVGGPRYEFAVGVPDTNEADKVFHFSVDGTREVPDAAVGP